MYDYYIAELKKLYAEIDKNVDHFCRETEITCIFGCGDCCQRFEPYISTLEATILADYLRQNPELLHRFENRPRSGGETLCPFFQMFQPYHCGIYAIRPLICRLFAFSARDFKDKRRYEGCKILREYCPDQVQKANELMEQGMPILTYAAMHERLRKIDYILATDMHPLTYSIEIALEKHEQIVSGEYQKQQQQQQQTTVSSILRNQYTS